MLWLVAALAGCDGEPECVQLPATCTPQYTPTFDGVWANTLATSCALSGCHGTGAGGLTMGTTQESAYAALLDGGYVLPGDPECSEMVRRIEHGGADVMPPGSPLAAQERCSVEEWIRDGADP
jgi:hypothetical protein